MNEKYEYENRPLNKPLARPLIRKLYLGKGYHTVNEIKDGVLQYHLDQGGGAAIKSLHGVIYKILVRWKWEGKAARSEDRRSWKILPSADDDNIKRELAHQEIINIFEEIKARDARIERLEKVILFLMSSRAGAGYHNKSAQEMLRDVLPASPKEKWVEKIFDEFGSYEKALDEFAAICEKRLESRDR